MWHDLLIRILSRYASVYSDNDNLNINGYKLVRADHREHKERWCVCYKEFVPVRYLPNSYLKDCLILEVSINNNINRLFHCTSHLVKLLMDMTRLLLV